MSVSLYRKYRPQDFSSLVGQRAAVEVLANSITKDRVGHAYLFSGSRGCGKTSAARIFAKALNCTNRNGFEPCGECDNCREITSGDSLDVIEIDGASNNGVENIRGLKENVALAPFNSRYKVYIIDEVHMLSQGAFNALLKTLEEPPEHVIFIMATTEPHKVPVTIRSRCQHIPFRSITPDDIYTRLDFVCKSEGITSEPEALREISRQADGALRDALSLLEQAASAGDVTLANIEALFGAGSRPAFERWIVSLRGNPGEAYSSLKAMFDAGASGVRVFEEMFSIVRDLWLVSKWKNIADNLGISSQEKTFLLDEASHWTADNLHSLLNVVLKSLTDARLGVRNDILLGTFMLRLEAGNEPPQTVTVTRREPLRIEPTISAPALSESPMPAITAPAPQPVKEDTALKESLLEIAREKNLVLWCGLFDARPYVRGKDLVLDMGHKYCYEVLRVYRTAFELGGLFPEYENVILRYLLSEFTCPKIETESATVAPESPANDTKPTPDTVPEIDQPPTPEYVPESDEPQEKHEPSAFREFIRDLTRLKSKPEVILQKKKDSQEDNETDNDESESVTESESEGDNEE